MHASKVCGLLAAMSLVFGALSFASPAHASGAADRASAADRLASWRPAAKPQCRKSCGKETNCYPGECYLIGEELRCGPDNCVTRNACKVTCE